MSDESYKLLTPSEVNKYKTCEWFNHEVIKSGNLFLIPEKYLLKDIDKKKFWLNKLQELIDEFDFERVHECMDVLNWVWAGVDGIPEKKDMIPVVKSLYSSIEGKVLEGNYCYCTTGGFKLTFNPDEDNELSLVFEVENCSVYGD